MEFVAGKFILDITFVQFFIWFVSTKNKDLYSLYDVIKNKIYTVILLYSRDTTIRIHIHAETNLTIMTNEHTSLEKYTSHFILERVVKGLCVRGELETEQTATY